MADLSNDEILDLIKKHESGGQNITNYRYDPTHTAQGYYQITNENWGKIGPQVGIDTKKYPRAMAAPEAEQRRVADYLLNNTPKGALNWESPSFRKAVGITDEEPKKEMAQAQDVKKPEKVDPNDLSKLSDEDLDKQIAELQGQIQKTKSEATAKEEPSMKMGPSWEPQWMKSLDVKTKEFLDKAADRPIYDPRGGFGVLSGLGKIMRSEYEPSWAGAGADVAGGMQEMGTIPNLALGGADLLATKGAAAWPMIKGAVTGYGTRKLGEFGADVFGADPDTKRLVGEITGLAGNILGPSLRMPGNMGTRAQGAFETFGPSARRVSGIRKMATGEAPGGKVGEPPQKFMSESQHSDIISNLPPGPERLQARNEMIDSLEKQGYQRPEAVKMADNAYGKALTADAEKLAASQTKPEKPPKITYQQMDRNVAAAPAQGRMALKQRYIEILTSQGIPPDIAEQHFNTALTEAHQADLEIQRKADAARPKGPSAKELEDLKGMMKTGILSSEDFRQQMSQWLSPEQVQHHIQDALSQRFGPGQQVQITPQRIPAQSIPSPPQGPPQGLVQPPQGGFNQVLGAGSVGGEPSNLTKFKPQFGPVGPMHGPEPRPFTPELPPAEIPPASTKLVHSSSQALFKGNYDLDKIPADNRDWRMEFKDKNKLASVPTEKTVREAVGIARIMKAKAARGEKIPEPPQVKIGRTEKGRFYKIENQ